jgi:biopolymer transport protein ExbD
MRLPDEPDLPAQINIVPMIDIVFALLTFFIMSSLSLTRSQGLPVNLPQASTAKSQQQKQVVITIDPAGKLSLKQQPIALEQITSQIQTFVQANKDAIVVINADEQVPHGRVIAVMDQVRRVPGAKLAIGTQQLKQP